MAVDVSISWPLMFRFNYFLHDLFTGKSTLLNLIANRIPQNVLNNNLTDKPNSANTSIKTSNKAHMNSVYSGDGLVLYNGQIPSAARVRSLIGYGKYTVTVVYHCRSA